MAARWMFCDIGCPRTTHYDTKPKQPKKQKTLQNEMVIKIAAPIKPRYRLQSNVSSMTIHAEAN